MPSAPEPRRSWRRYADDLEDHFNPRRRIPDADARLAARRQASAAVREHLRSDIDLRYGAGSRQVLDVFHPVVPGSSVLVFIHGGYWRGGDKAISSLVAEPFVAQGIPTFVLNYDLCPAVPLARIVEEVDEALAWIGQFAMSHAYGDRIFLFGHSAGAHLCAMALSRLPPKHPVIGAAMVSGLFDLEPILQLEVNREIRLQETDVAPLSPLRLPVPADVPLLLSIGGREAAGWRSQTKDYLDHCLSSGATAELFDCEHQDHMSLLEHHLSSDSSMRDRMFQIMTR